MGRSVSGVHTKNPFNGRPDRRPPKLRKKMSIANLVRLLRPRVPLTGGLGASHRRWLLPDTQHTRAYRRASAGAGKQR